MAGRKKGARPKNWRCSKCKAPLGKVTRKRYVTDKYFENGRRRRVVTDVYRKTCPKCGHRNEFHR